ncbi:MAG TPA: histidine phosphatase family protein [Terriglobia bacterium]|nr:histidine phosphatase family protein [Terriglobia bacterium]
MRLHFIRHGETEWSLSGQHTGRTNIPLTARGEDEAKELALRLQAVPFAHVLTSPRRRARRTCELVGLGPAADIEPDLAEWDYGDYEGMRSVDIRKTRPDWSLFRDGCPNGESPAQATVRADRLIARLRAMEGNVALFSHGQFGRVLAARWIGLPLVEAQHLALGTASISILACDPHNPTVPVIALWNEASREALDSGPSPRPGDKRTVTQQAIERWENEGGEIPGASADAERPTVDAAQWS